jgi:hypothetical protein
MTDSDMGFVVHRPGYRLYRVPDGAWATVNGVDVDPDDWTKPLDPEKPISGPIPDKPEPINEDPMRETNP